MYRILPFLLLTCTVSVDAQNVIANGGFEIYSQQPDNTGQIERTVGWNKLYKTPDYMHELYYPSHSWAFQQTNGAASGFGYAGLYASAACSSCSEAIGQDLCGAELIAGETYNISVQAKRSSTGFLSSCQGRVELYGLSTAPGFNPIDQHVSENPDATLLWASDAVSDLSWAEFSGSFVAPEAFSYLALSNIFCPDGSAYLFVDDLVVSGPTNDPPNYDVALDILNTSCNGSGTAVATVQLCNQGSQTIEAGMPIRGQSTNEDLSGAVSELTITDQPIAPGECLVIGIPFTPNDQVVFFANRGPFGGTLFQISSSFQGANFEECDYTNNLDVAPVDCSVVLPTTDLGITFEGITCTPSFNYATFEICNLGDEIVPAGMPINIYETDPIQVGLDDGFTTYVSQPLPPDSCRNLLVLGSGDDTTYVAINILYGQSVPLDLSTAVGDVVTETNTSNNFSAAFSFECDDEPPTDFDLSAEVIAVDCDPNDGTASGLTVQICNQGTEPSPGGIPHGYYTVNSLQPNNPVVPYAFDLPALAVGSCTEFSIVPPDGDSYYVVNADESVSGPLDYGPNAAWAVVDEAKLSNNFLAFADYINGPELDLGGFVYNCNGSATVLGTGDYFDTYLWNTGATTPEISTDSPGLSWLEVTDDCSGTQRDTVYVGYNYFFQVFLNAPDTICAGDPATLTVTNHFNVRWSQNGNVLCEPCPSYTFNPSEDTAVDVRVESLDGCVYETTVDIAVVEPFFATETIDACAGEVVEIDGFSFSNDTLLVRSFTSAQGCDSTYETVLNFWENPATEVNLESCTGTPVTIFGNAETATGVYQQTFTSYRGCDSTVTVALTVHPVWQTSDTLRFCSGETIDFLGETYSETTLVTQSMLSYENCDSTHQTLLQFAPTYLSTETISACAGDALTVFGASFTQDTLVVRELTSIDGCDSIEQILLVFNDALFTNETLLGCTGETFDVFGQQISSDTLLTQTLSSAAGCDSTHTVEVRFGSPSLEIVEQENCDGELIEVFGNSVFQSGSYEQTFASYYGCDSTIRVELTILPFLQTFDTLTYCSGETALFNGNAYTETVQLTESLVSYRNCDSLHRTLLLFQPTFEQTDTVTSCLGEVVEVFGAPFAQDTVLEQSFVSGTGCDSTERVVLRFLPEITTYETQTACADQSVSIFGNLYSTDTLVSQTVTTLTGCDSTHTVALTFLATAESQSTPTLCAGEIFTLDGANYTTDTTLLQTLTASNGCDSTHQTILTFLPNAATAASYELCAGESMEVFGQMVSSQQTLSATFPAANGCDSIHTVSVNFREEVYGFSTENACAGDTLLVDGRAITDNEVLFQTLTATNGCDSLHELTLLFEPLPVVQQRRVLCGEPFYLFGEDTLRTDGTYEAYVPGVATGCDTLVQLALQFLEAPAAELPVDTLVPQNATLILPLTNYRSDEQFRWSPATGLSCTDCPNPRLLVDGDAKYGVEISNAGGCLQQLSIQIRTEPLPAVFVPNAFSPNNDGRNDRFVLRANEGVEQFRDLRIFDRWGGLMFQRNDCPPNDPSAGWDGRTGDLDVPTGVYTYNFTILYQSGRTEVRSGTVALLR